VTLVATQNSQSALSSGVEAGERVVVDGVDSLREGAKVRVVSDALPGESTDEVNDAASASADGDDGNDGENRGENGSAS